MKQRRRPANQKQEQRSAVRLTLLSFATGVSLTLCAVYFSLYWSFALQAYLNPSLASTFEPSIKGFLGLSATFGIAGFIFIISTICEWILIETRKKGKWLNRLPLILFLVGLTVICVGSVSLYWFWQNIFTVFEHL
jgi:hypothetical protein